MDTPEQIRALLAHLRDASGDEASRLRAEVHRLVRVEADGGGRYVQAMNLSDFVAESLEAIVEGSQRAAEKIGAAGGIVNPEYAGATYPKGERTTERGGRLYYLVNVDFDVGVTRSEGSGSEAGGKLSVWGIGDVGGSTEGSREHRAENRLRFTIPLALPQPKQPSD